MLGETTFFTYVAFGAIILLLIVLVVMFLRVMFWVSLLLIAPVAELLRRIPVVRRWGPSEESSRSGLRRKGDTEA